MAWALFLFCCAARAHSDNWGVILPGGPGKGSITDPLDVDSYVVHAARGDLLDVEVRVSRGTSLEPQLALFGPDSSELTPSLRRTATGVGFKGLLVPFTGVHRIDVSGGAGSVGPYEVKARVRPAKGPVLRDTPIAPGAELSVPFAAPGGARLTVNVRSRGEAPVAVRIEDPFGIALQLPDAAFTSKERKLVGRRIDLRRDPLFGEWRLVLRGRDETTAIESVNVRVKAQKVRSAVKRLPDVEPRISGVLPAEAGRGTRLTLSGTGFASTSRTPLRVFVGGREADSVELLDPTRIEATMPGNLAGPVDVAILNGDGHAPVAPGAVLAVPPPAITRVVPERGPAAGGILVEITGRDFRPGSAMTLAGVPFEGLTEVVSDTLIHFTTPGFAAGLQTLAVLDPTGQVGLASRGFEFVPEPTVVDLRPPLIPHLAGERLELDGGNFLPGATLKVGGEDPVSVERTGTTRLTATLPLLPLGPKDVKVNDEFGKGPLLGSAVRVFDFQALPSLPGADTATPSDMAFADYDQDGDLDLFLIWSGGAVLGNDSALRVLRRDGDSYTDVTTDTLPAIQDDDWRGGAIAVGDVAAGPGASAPDGWPDLVLGSNDTTVLPAGRSRTRILANRSIGGIRRFEDVSVELMATPTAFDDWKAQDLWVGDLDGDGGIADILATHDASPAGDSPLPPYYAYYESGTRLFQSAGGASAPFAWQPRRFPSLLGSRRPVAGLPLCAGECADDFNPFRGVGLAVLDLDGDGRKDVAVTTPSTVTVQGSAISSTQLGRNLQPVAQIPAFEDNTQDLPLGSTRLAGSIVMFGNVTGDPRPDMVVVARSAAAGERAIRVLEFRGWDTSWRDVTDTVIPEPDGDERYQAHAAALVNVDSDGYVDIVLLTTPAPGTGPGLRILRNRGPDQVFERSLEGLFPTPDQDERLDGDALLIGIPSPGGDLEFLAGRSDPAGAAPRIRGLRRSTDE